MPFHHFLSALFTFDFRHYKALLIISSLISLVSYAMIIKRGLRFGFNPYTVIKLIRHPHSRLSKCQNVCYYTPLLQSLEFQSERQDLNLLNRSLLEPPISPNQKAPSRIILKLSFNKINLFLSYI